MYQGEGVDVCNQSFVSFVGTISGSTDPDGLILKLAPLQIVTVLFGINAIELTITVEILVVKDPHPPAEY